MSQPPPPDQPPSGNQGYGYPPTPPPGQPPSSGQGYGYPQTPPPGQSGYGYPQSPPSLDKSSPPPGQPPQTPPPTVAEAPTQVAMPGPGQSPTPPPGQPPQTPPPTVAGAPTQVAMPGPGQSGTLPGMPPGAPPPPGGGGKGKVIGIVAAVLAALLVAGGGVWFFLQGDDKDDQAKGDDKSATQGAGGGGDGGGPPKPINAKLAWQAKHPPLKKGSDSAAARQTFFVGDNVVRALPGGLTAYNLASGEEAWSLELPRDEECAIATQASDGKTALLHGKRCQQISAVDLNTGEQLWTHKLPKAGSSDTQFQTASVAVAGDLVAVNWSSAGVGWKMGSGETVWAGESKGDCYLKGYAGGKQIIAHQRCIEENAEVLLGLAPDGSVAWEWKTPKKVRVEQIFSQEPLLVAVGLGGSITDVMYVENGELKQRIPLDKKRFSFLGCSLNGLGGCAVLTDDSRMYLETERHRGKEEDKEVNEIVAIDYKTGKQVFQFESMHGGILAPLALADGRLVAYERPGYGEPGKVLSFDVKTQKGAVAMHLPEDSKALEQNLYFGGAVHWHDNRLYMHPVRYSDEGEQYAVVAFGG